MVDAILTWENRLKSDRATHNLCGLSNPVFTRVKEHYVLYSDGVDPLPFWADWSWFPLIHASRIRVYDQEVVVARLKEHWSRTPRGSIQLSPQEAEENRYGGISPRDKYDPAIRYVSHNWGANYFLF